MPIVTQEDVSGLIAVAEFIDALEMETDVPERLRDLAQRLSTLVILPADG